MSDTAQAVARLTQDINHPECPMHWKTRENIKELIAALAAEKQRADDLKASLEKHVEHIAELRAWHDAAMREASGLATSMFKRHYAQDEHYKSGVVKWQLCDSVAGIISQIDNMHAGVVERMQPART
jgi:uncharacterized protein YgbK (DUF1537 family)